MSFLGQLTRALVRGGGGVGAGSRPSRADTSLLGGKRILFGNKVSHSEHKTRRTWKPNVHRHKLYSSVLEEMLVLPVSTSVLRTIERYGGIDQYLLITPDKKIDSELGVALKRRMEERLKKGAVPPVIPDENARLRARRIEF